MRTAKNDAAWDRHAIKAEIQRRGMTLKGLALHAGLEESSIRVALRRSFPKAERAISRFLGVPLKVLWPQRYGASSKSERRSTQPSQRTSRIRNSNSTGVQ
ncbi:MAG: helix-turn-helix domain-containing protein [Rhizobiaceae bacterium]|nr:helix-turn-helix domain-containing protein [Rhizobiaceae bacterium]